MSERITDLVTTMRYTNRRILYFTSKAAVSMSIV